ncbi:hypothetical protein BDR04DRAFT_898378 [Suillus decipiens]|nr:hypothetical protein BDR04DRAFT_898378 [Suillus decipiens]
MVKSSRRRPIILRHHSQRFPKNVELAPRPLLFQQVLHDLQKYTSTTSLAPLLSTIALCRYVTILFLGHDHVCDDSQCNDDGSVVGKTAPLRRASCAKMFGNISGVLVKLGTTSSSTRGPGGNLDKLDDNNITMFFLPFVQVEPYHLHHPQAVLGTRLKMPTEKHPDGRPPAKIPSTSGCMLRLYSIANFMP